MFDFLDVCFFGWIVESHGERWCVVLDVSTVYVAIRWTSDLPAQAHVILKSQCSEPRMPTKDEWVELQRVKERLEAGR